MKPDVVKIAITAADGSVMIMNFVTNDHKVHACEPTEENINKEIEKTSISLDPEKLPIQGWRIIEDETEIPTCREYRNAWHDDGGIKIHMGKAKDIHRNKLREQRAFKLAALDIEYQKADELGATLEKQIISRKKQKLRDITKHPDIEAAETVEDLKLITIETHGE